MIVNIVLNLKDFEFNFDKLRDLYNKESDLFKDKFVFNKRVDWIQFQQHVINNKDKYKEFSSDFSSYEIFHCDIIKNLMLGKKLCNQKLASFCNQYLIALDQQAHESSTNIFIISHALIKNPLRYWDEQNKIITYNELDLFKRLLILNSLGLLNRNKFGFDLLHLLTIHYGIIEITKKDLDNYFNEL